MRVVYILLTALSLKLCGADAVPAAPDAARIAGWIAQLGDADFTTRKTAEEELAKVGAAAQKGLEAAVKSEDAEVRERAERLLSRARVGQILKKIDELPPNLQSVEADLRMLQKDGMEISGSGHFKALPDGKHLLLEMQLKLINETEIKMKIVADGTFQWGESGMTGGGGGGNKSVQKYSLKAMEENRERGGVMQHFLTCPVKQQFKVFCKRCTFVAGRDGKLDGAEVYILDGEGKAGAGGLGHNHQFVRLYVDKSTAFIRKVEMLDARREVVMRLEFLNLKLGQKFEQSLFVYKPPEGVTVTDMDETLQKKKQEKE